MRGSNNKVNIGFNYGSKQDEVATGEFTIKGTFAQREPDLALNQFHGIKFHAGVRPWYLE